MKSPFRKTVRLNLLNNLLFMTLLFVACEAASVAETTTVTQERDLGNAPIISATPQKISTIKATVTITPVNTETLPAPTMTTSPSDTPSPQPTQTFMPTPSPLGGWLVFESAHEDTNGDDLIDISDNIHIYSMNLSTNELVQLTYDSHRDTLPSWSPDRSEIVFASNRSGNADLYVMNADGSNLRQLTHTPENETTPIWTTNGQQIIYVLVRTLEYGLQESHLYIMSASGENNHQLVNLPGNSIDPDLSPDGRFLAYTQKEPVLFEEETRTRTVVYLYDMQSGKNIRITSSAFESDRGQFQKAKWLPREGWYLSMLQVPGDMNPVGLKVFELTWDDEAPLLQQVLEFDEGSGNYTWGPNGECLISADYRTLINEEGEAIMTTDLFTIPITIPEPQTQLQVDPAMQRSEHVLQGEGTWLTNDPYYEGNLDWAP
ncbi:MAG: PD40 domain-containing protein [Chloroflexi bacterium]|nr:PD40 domain-containing protein [Chloroflexota bacterium]